MNPQRHERLKRVFLAACELPHDQVSAYLDEVCGDDRELRSEAESLLAHHFTETIIRTPAGPSPPPADALSPGQILLGRYRLFGPLGRGGMGEVYRADDLKLDQPVALKFLDHERNQDPQWIRRYENEVRLARRVAHPNVVRVYDIVEGDGHVFIVMEFVDGEDLGSLLRRVGRLTGDKAMQIARELCCGLGAAHDHGVLHRDLKPANVMIDGHGRARIADFGIATLISDVESGLRGPGTPAYMAPELWCGGHPTRRSDLYSLGMVLYELTSGRAPFAGKGPGDPVRRTPPAQISETAPDVDPQWEAAILRCLDAESQRRPESAYAIVAALPGGTPFEAAIAAGATPSPSMVAAATAPLPQLPRAAACLGIAVLGLLLVLLLADRAFLLPRAGLTKAPAVLADRAEQVMRTFGCNPGPGRCGQGFFIDRENLSQAMASDARGEWSNLDSRRALPVCYWYQCGMPPSSRPMLLGESPADDSPSSETSPATVILDCRGRLLRFAAAAKSLGRDEGSADLPKWSEAFDLAGLNLQDFRLTPAASNDGLFIWDGEDRDTLGGIAIRVTASARAGCITSFEVLPAWRRSGQASGLGRDETTRVARPLTSRVALDLVGIFLGGLLAWQNMRRTRGDYRSANRLALFIFFLGLADWLLGESHSRMLGEELVSLYVATARSILTAMTAWLCYVAVEPYIRRFWPETLVTWTRAMNGRFRDPWLGRDVLLGVTAGVLLVFLLEIDTLLPSWIGIRSPGPRLPPAGCDLAAVLGLRYRWNVVVGALIGSITLGLIVLLLALIMRLVLRRTFAALAATVLLLTAIEMMSAVNKFGFPLVTPGLMAIAALAILRRGGLIALVAASFTWSILTTSPLTLHFHRWYAPAGATALAVLGVISVWAFAAARAGRPLLPWSSGGNIPLDRAG